MIVVWRHESVGPAGDFVREEAGQAKQRGVLVPVMLEKVAPPLGFGEIQAIDLIRWKRKPRDPFFQDLCAAVTAKLEGPRSTTRKGPYDSLGATPHLGQSGKRSRVWRFGARLQLVQRARPTVQRTVLQPQISDMCGALGLGNRATKAERVDGRVGRPEVVMRCANTLSIFRRARIEIRQRTCSRRGERRKRRFGHQERAASPVRGSG